MAIVSEKVNFGYAPYYEVYQFIIYLILILAIIGVIYLIRRYYIKFMRR